MIPITQWSRSHLITGMMLVLCILIIIALLNPHQSEGVTERHARLDKAGKLRADNMAEMLEAYSRSDKSIGKAIMKYSEYIQSYAPFLHLTSSDLASMKEARSAEFMTVNPLEITHRLGIPMTDITQNTMDPFRRQHPYLPFAVTITANSGITFISVGPDDIFQTLDLETTTSLHTRSVVYDPTNGLRSAGDIYYGPYVIH